MINYEQPYVRVTIFIQFHGTPLDQMYMLHLDNVKLIKAVCNFSQPIMCLLQNEDNTAICPSLVAIFSLVSLPTS